MYCGWGTVTTVIFVVFSHCSSGHDIEGNVLFLVVAFLQSNGRRHLTDLDSFVKLCFFLKCFGALYTNELDTHLKCLIQLYLCSCLDFELDSIHLLFFPLFSQKLKLCIWEPNTEHVFDIYWISVSYWPAEKSSLNYSGTGSW